MQVLLDPLNKIRIELKGRHVAGSSAKLLFGKRPNFLADGDLFITCKDVGHLARVQHVVNILDKPFLSNLRVREQEH